MDCFYHPHLLIGAIIERNPVANSNGVCGFYALHPELALELTPGSETICCFYRKPTACRFYNYSFQNRVAI